MSANASVQAKLGLSEADNEVTNVEIAVEMLAGSEPLAEGATYADVAAFVRGCLADWVNRAPANWPTVFRGLISP